MLLNAKADVHLQDYITGAYGATALHIISLASTSCVSLLLNAKADLWLEDDGRRTPMYISLVHEHVNDDIMRLLLERGTCQDTGFTALMEASRQGYVPAIQKLLALGANVYGNDKYGTTALDVSSSEECTMLLRQHTTMSAPLPPPPESPQPDVPDEKTMIAKAWRNKLTSDELTQCIAAGKDVNYQDEGGYTALMMTAYNGQTELVQMLLDANADVNMHDINGDTALHMAPFGGQMTCTVLLVDAKANLWLGNKHGETPMCYGLRQQHANDNMMRLLLERGTCQDTGFTALLEASRQGYVSAIQKLLTIGANVYEKDKYGTTALDVASSEECTMLLRQHTTMSAPLPPPPESPQPDVLDEKTMIDKARRNKLTADELTQYIAAGKDVNYQNEGGDTALMITAYNGQTELVQMLLDANADVNMHDINGYTALHLAAFRGHMACILLLVDAKANLWLKGNAGDTPLSHVMLSQHSNDDMMRFCIEHGTCQDTGFTALMDASRRGYYPAVTKLLALGANVYEKDKYGTTALDVASSEECEMLLRQHTMMSAPLPPPPELCCFSFHWPSP